MKRMKYDQFMDKECVDLCDTLNSLKGVRTTESCCGHLKDPYMVFMHVNNFYSLAILGRVFDSRYSNGEWSLEVITADSVMKPFATFELLLIRKKVFSSDIQMAGEIKTVIKNIKYWSKRKFKKHLMGKKE